MGNCTIAVHSYRRTSGGYPHESSGKDKFCLFQRNDGDDQESISVAGMDKLRIQWELQYKWSSASDSVMASSTEGSNAEDEGHQDRRGCFSPYKTFLNLHT